MNTTVLAAGTAPNVTSRVVALVSASVFDASTAIDPRFRPIHVRPNAPRNASQRAAAIQAAYAILFNLYPSATLTARRDASLAALASTEKRKPSRRVSPGAKRLPNAIWALRLTDGFAPTRRHSSACWASSEHRVPWALGARHRKGLPDQPPGNPGATPRSHHDPVGTHAAIAVPLLAAAWLSQPGVR